jgi:hypothetical protein
MHKTILAALFIAVCAGVSYADETGANKVPAADKAAANIDPK